MILLKRRLRISRTIILKSKNPFGQRSTLNRIMTLINAFQLIVSINKKSKKKKRIKIKVYKFRLNP